MGMGFRMFANIVGSPCNSTGGAWFPSPGSVTAVSCWVSSRPDTWLQLHLRVLTLERCPAAGLPNSTPCWNNPGSFGSFQCLGLTLNQLNSICGDGDHVLLLSQVSPGNYNLQKELRTIALGRSHTKNEIACGTDCHKRTEMRLVGRGARKNKYEREGHGRFPTE